MTDFERCLLAFSPAVIYTCQADGDYRTTYVSDNVKNLLGYAPEDFLVDANFWGDHIHPDDLTRVHTGLEQLATKDHHVHEYRFRAYDGEYRWMRDELRRVRDEQSGIVGLIGSWLDITERKIMEEDYRRFTELTSDYVHYCTRKGADPFRVRWIAGAVNSISGYSIQNVLDLGCWLPLVHSDDRDAVAAYLFNLMPGDSGEIEFRIVTPAGEVRWVQEKSRCEAGPMEGELVLYGAVTDITERKRAELRLLESDRMKSEFIATASHELRTPLAVIQGYAELLLDDAELGAAQQREFLEVIYDKSLALEKIVDDLLDVSRVESGRIICLEFVQCNIIADIRQVVAHFKREASGHRFSLRLPEEELCLAVDQGKIIQVLENLLGNAVKFSPGGGEVAIQAEWHDECLQVTIKDSGVGIAPGHQEHIFDKFYRVDSTDIAVPGLGIGLYLVKKIIEAHRGRVWVESVLGRGTKFFFTLPR